MGCGGRGQILSSRENLKEKIKTCICEKQVQRHAVKKNVAVFSVQYQKNTYFFLMSVI